MLDPHAFYSLLIQHGVDFSTGVPDSLLKNFCACLADSGTDIIAANEGNAIAMAAGHHLATGKIPFVYMQNSGFGNAVNPFTSLTDPEVYAIPMLVMVGWRGEPGVPDEPQHVKMGRINQKILEVLELPFVLLSPDLEQAAIQLETAFFQMKFNPSPYILLVQAGTFGKYKPEKQVQGPLYGWTRENVIETVLSMAPAAAVFVSTTGKTSREVFEFRAARGQGHEQDFLTVGCMGHASSIAAGIALAKPGTQIFCLDGDGAMIMHLGAAAVIGSESPPNLYHILINNGTHDSVGAQPTAAFSMDFPAIATACGYTFAARADNATALQKIWPSFSTARGPAFLEIRCDSGARENLGRPTRSPKENKADFQKLLSTKS